MPVTSLGQPAVEPLRYANPFRQRLYPVWHRYEQYFAVDANTPVIWSQKPQVPVVEYIFRYGTPDNPGVRVAEQHPVFSLIPANFHYQPIVEVADVYVPDDYEANTLKSESQVLALPYAISHTGRYAVHFDM